MIIKLKSTALIIERDCAHVTSGNEVDSCITNFLWITNWLTSDFLLDKWEMHLKFYAIIS